MADKVDFKRADPYQAKVGTFRIIDVPAMQYLMLDGSGDPNTSSQFAASLEALYPVAYTLKFFSKRQLDRDYVVPPLEGLWWAEDMATFTVARDKSQWSWTLMLMVPEWLQVDHVEAARAQVAAKGAPERLADVRFERLAEGRCVQTLHVGTYDDEAEVLERMHQEFIPANGLRMTGRHHEIYLSDARKVAPEKRRTLLRQPVGPAA